MDHAVMLRQAGQPEKANELEARAKAIKEK